MYRNSHKIPLYLFEIFLNANSNLIVEFNKMKLIFLIKPMKPSNKQLYFYCNEKFFVMFLKYANFNIYSLAIYVY